MYINAPKADYSQQQHLNHSSSRSFTDATSCMSELEDILAELGLSAYLHDFLEQGFDTWYTILDIKESDFDVLGVKLGHRRKLQRKIASLRGLSSDRALESPGNTPSGGRHPDKQKVGGAKADAKDSGSGIQAGKRKYRRHPKPDENAPKRPPSAYVIFTNFIREEHKERNLSFTEIAKLVGEYWQNLLPSEKDRYVQQACTAKGRYNNELAEYKKTDSYREYGQYLAKFKAKQSNQQSVIGLDASKRPKLEAQGSAASSGNTKQRVDTPSSQRVECSSNITHWPKGNGHMSSPQSSNMPKLSVSIGDPKHQGSPNTKFPTILPGYHESIFGGGHQSLPRSQGQRNESTPSLQQFPKMANAGDCRASHPGLPATDHLNLTGSVQNAFRTGQSHPPLLLKSESTNRSSTSSPSTGLSVFFSPRAPMEPPLERVMPPPSIYSQKSTGSYENQLPPLRPPSLFPQTTMLGSQQSPNSVLPIMDFPITIAPLHGYNYTAPQYSGPANPRQCDYTPSNPADDNLDPISALLKAGEIVYCNSRGRPGP